MPRERKFDFMPIPTGQETHIEPMVNIYKSGQMFINRAANQHYGLEGKAIQFVYDAKTKAFGLKEVMYQYEGPNWDKKTMRLLKVSERIPGGIFVSVGQVLRRLGLNKKDFKKMKLKSYSSLSDHNRTTWYVILREKKDKEEDNGEID